MANMVSRSISKQIIKKLYAISGNQCAFPDCNEKLVTENGTVVSEMCHIEGIALKAPRHNTTLTPEQTNDFPNLIVLCLKHHTIIDKEESSYTVDILKKMKQDHENNFRQSQYQISEQLVEKIQKNFEGQLNIHTGSGNQFVTGSGDITLGITSISDVRELVVILFEENFPKLRKIADQAAHENIKKFEDAFVNRLKSELKPDDIKKLSDPDLQYILTKSVMQAGRKDSNELRENLAYLITERIKNHEHNLKSLVYNEAIETIGKLTIDELKIITLCFILRYTRRLKIKHIDELDNFLKLLEPLYDFNNTNAEFQHVEYAGCGGLGIGSWHYVKSLAESYPELFPLTISADHLVGHNIPSEIMQDIFTTISEKEFEFKIVNEKELNSYLDSQSVDDIIKNEIRSQFSTANQGQTRKINDLIKNSKEILKVNEIVSNSSIEHLTLTSVGIVIGAMYYEKIIGEKIPIDIWIN